MGAIMTRKSCAVGMRNAILRNHRNLILVVPVTRRTADQSGICYRDVCKEELFLPLTEAYQGERDKALALSLFLIFLALVTFAVTKPWG